MTGSSPVTRCSRDNVKATVREQLTRSLRRYGLPDGMLMDNGPRWGSPCTAGRLDPPHHTRFTVSLMRLGVTVTRSRPFHPQTVGKDERFHRTLEVEVLRYGSFSSVRHTQKRFDDWQGCLRPGAAPRNPGHGRAGRAIPAQFTAISREAAGDRIPIDRSGQARLQQRPDSLGRTPGPNRRRVRRASRSRSDPPPRRDDGTCSSVIRRFVK